MHKRATRFNFTCSLCAVIQPLALTLCVGLLISCAPPPSHSSNEALQMTDPWIRQAPPGARMLAAYGTLHNRSTQKIQIVHVESEQFESATFHETTLTAGVARMRMLPNVSVMPKSSIDFTPGGIHIMLMEPTEPVVTGQSIKIQFTLKNGTQIGANFIVEKR